VKKAALEKWKIKWTVCRKCPLGSRAFNHVPGHGSRSARILVVGEAPGDSENLLGKPFVGEAGRLMRDAWKLAGLPETLFFVTNMVACRPCDRAIARFRLPNQDEIRACRERLDELIEMMDPELIVSVGNVAAGFLGEVYRDVVVHRVVHPSYLLRHGCNREDVKRYANKWKEIVGCLN
jgi:uracil-DNA glycosylase